MKIVWKLMMWKTPVFTEESRCMRPVDFFDLLITNEVIHLIVQQTNLYATQYFEDNPNIPPRSRLKFWDRRDHTTAEFYQYLAINTVMGIIQYPKLEDYWSQSWPFASSMISSIMSRDRFSLIQKFLHVNDNRKQAQRNEPNYDPIYKIRLLITSVISNFQQNYQLGREVSLDEAVISFKGRIWFLQYMPKKPNKWGLKAFSVADAKTGYTYNWKLYAGV